MDLAAGRFALFFIAFLATFGVVRFDFFFAAFLVIFGAARFDLAFVFVFDLVLDFTAARARFGLGAAAARLPAPARLAKNLAIGSK